jgi:hypothetical protein
MNGCLVFLIMIYSFHHSLSARLRSILAHGFWDDVNRCLRQRDYLLRGLRHTGEVELWMRDRLVEQIRAGTLKEEDLDFLQRNCKESEQLNVGSLRLLLSYVTHFAFVLGMPALLRQWLCGKLWFDRTDAAEIVLAVGLAGLCMWVIHREWPKAALMDSAQFKAFVKAYWGDGRGGPFELRLAALHEAALREGVDSKPERVRYLREWHVAAIEAFRTRLNWFENALGPTELVASGIFAVLLLTLPLLNHFGALL